MLNVKYLVKQISFYFYYEWDELPTENEIRLVIDQFLKNHKTFFKMPADCQYFLMDKINQSVNRIVKKVF